MQTGYTKEDIKRTLLQRRKLLKSKSYSCRITKSDTKLNCGYWSYMKIAKVPMLEEQQYVSIEECNTLVNTMTFISPNGEKVQLKSGVVISHRI